MQNKDMLQAVPEHIAIIMDGNGRWASNRRQPRSAGHRAGAQALKALVTEAEKIGLKYLTVYAFSTENWSRSDDEVSYLMQLMREYIQQYIKDTKKNDARITILGDRSRLDSDLQEKIQYLENTTENKKGIHLAIALNYGGRDEILRAVKRLSADVKDGGLSPDDINEETIRTYLDTKAIPDPELLIRTSGELRISNFLLWQLAYTEFYFSDILWPDFNIKHLKDAIIDYNSRQRRFGGRY